MLSPCCLSADADFNRQATPNVASGNADEKGELCGWVHSFTLGRVGYDESMSEPALKREWTVDEFLDWAEAQERGRYELLRGEIVAMSPEPAGHARSKLNITRALTASIERTRIPCEAFVDSLAVVIDETTSYEPDVLVNCGPPVAPHSMKASNPLVVVEVLSPSTRNIDKSIKIPDYFRVPGLVHYLIVDLGRRNVLHYRRMTDGTITVAIQKDGAIQLDPPGLALDVADCLPAPA